MTLWRLVLLAALLGGCDLFEPSRTHVDYIDFVRNAGIEYWASFAQYGRPIEDADLGAAQFTVKQTLATAGRGPYYETQDGDASYIPTGSPVYAVRGYAPTFRVAARHDGRLVLYEAHMNANARGGRDLFDLEGKVRSIALLDPSRAGTVAGRIADPAGVDALVRMVLDARVSAPIAPSPGRRPELTVVTIVFEMKDGTATVRNYDVTNGVLAANVFVAAGFRDAIVALVPRDR